jgi:LPS sulfotransferase NodH
MSHHRLTYIICATPRSGTTLLTDLLTDTGAAGRPDSFFRRQSMRDYWARYFKLPAAHWGAKHEFDRSYLSAVLDYGTSGTSVFGMRLMWESVDDLLTRLDFYYPDLPSNHARLSAAFGEARYLHLSRQDKIAQAVSRLRAEQSGLWHRHADGSERERLNPDRAPVYDAAALSEIAARMVQQDAAWTSWFAQAGIEPVRLTYEALAADPRTVLAGVLTSLGLDPAIAEHVNPRTAKLAEEESQKWISRFRREHPGAN